MSRLRRPLVLILVAGLLGAACSTSVTVTPQEAVDEQPDGSQDQPDSGPNESSDSQDGDGSDPGTGTQSSAVDPVFDGRYSWEDASCEFVEPADVSTVCGWLEVPERWDMPDDTDTVRLHVAIFSAGPNSNAPTVYLEGGPGGDPLENIGLSFDILFGQLVSSSDIVVFGQRGTVMADPSLQCDEAIEYSLENLDSTAPVEELVAGELASYEACAQRLASADIDTEGYNSVQNAHDVEALRLALGHDQWNVLGISYGTRLGQTLLRLFPDGLRAVILDSVLSMDRDPSVDQPVTAKRAFEVLWARCDESPVCSSSYPNLETRFFDLVEALDESPVAFQTTDAATGELYDVAYSGDALLEESFSALYSKAAFAAIPELVAQLEAGETSAAQAMVSQTIASLDGISVGMYWSVECHEEVPFITDESVAAGLSGDPRYDRLAQPDLEGFLGDTCAAFDSGEAPAVEDEPVSSDVPVLVLAGEYDPITPPADGESILENLSASQFVQLPHTGHAASVDECGAQIGAAFLADPTAPVSADCISEIADPDWVPDVYGDLQLEPFSFDSGLVSASGVAPVGWDDFGDGVFVWQENVAHVALLLQQVVGSVPDNLLISSFESAFGGTFVEVERRNGGGKDWVRYELTSGGSVIDFLLASDDDNSYIVVMQNAPSDRDAALATLVEPVLDAISE